MKFVTKIVSIALAAIALCGVGIGGGLPRVPDRSAERVPAGLHLSRRLPVAGRQEPVAGPDRSPRR